MSVLGIPLDTVLQTQRCRLRAASEDDVELVWTASRVPGFNDGMQWDPPETRAEIAEYARRSVEAWRAGTDFSFTVVDKASGVLLGRAGLHRLGPDGSWAIGYWIHPQHWRRGYATEAARAAVDFAFGRLGAARLVLPHATWNDASRRVAEKLGFRPVRETPCGFMKRGQPVPELVHVLEAPHNKRTVQRFMEAFSRSDRPAVIACLTDDVEWILPGASHLHGKAQFEREIVNPAFEPNPRIVVTRLTEQADVVVAEGDVRTVKKTGEQLHLAFCDVFEMREARISRLTSYLHTLPQ